MILIGFLLYRSHDVVERPGYRIDCRTITRGSRPSILIILFVESSNLCILESSLLVLIWLLSWCGLGACRACHDKAKFTENDFHMRLLLRFWYWRFCRFILVCNYLQNLLYLFSIFPRISLVVHFPAKLVSLHSDLFPVLYTKVFPFPHLVLFSLVVL